MRDETDDQVAARLRSVFSGVRPATAPFEDRSPLAWSDVVPGWSDDDTGAGRLGVRSAWTGPAASADPGSSSSPSGPALLRGAFDPGRRGARALIAVAAVVVVIAAFLAWRARPQVEPVPPPVASSSDSEPEPVESTAEVVVSVAGKVGKPGLVRLPAGARVADALTAAGGPQPGVDVAMLNLARKVVDGELILVGVTPSPGQAVPQGAPGGTAPAGGPVNLNTATLADLDTLPGVGPVLAQRILDARDSKGGFRAVSDLRQVDGIGESRYEQLKDLVTV